MPKGPKVIGVLTEPAPASWWRTNRHKVLLAAGLLLGYLIGTHTADAAPQQPQPRPAHTTPGTTNHPAAALRGAAA